MSERRFKIAVFPGDGIGQDVTEAALAVLGEAVAGVGGFALNCERLQAGAAHYKATGEDISQDAFEAARQADAILLGAIGDPAIRYPDGTEISPHLRMRDAFGLFAGVRPVKAYPNTPLYLADPRAQEIDLVILRESTEGLFYSHGRGEVIDDSEARETLRITRATCENLFDFAFDLARRRQARGGKGHVTCVDKANVFKAMAFFRKIFDERAALNDDIAVGHTYVDAQALFLVRKPWAFDVLVMENMFGDILSDIAGGIVGGMGMAPCAEIGLEHGLFQPAHGSAPDIAGQDKANPIAAILSGAMMLDWLGARHGVEPAVAAARLIEAAVTEGFASGRVQPAEFGGPHGTAEITRTLLDIVRETGQAKGRPAA
ncbi:MAG: isocitrate/isopropylmalate family dehydrogenase [Hyphomicrobiales bacterium]|nr:isocitrate/isopropylmalate family dehydrogenase [Hyphomicrobiales bacterium]